MKKNDVVQNTLSAGFRLQALEVLNWGTFHHKLWKIEPQGNNSLLTGDIGSGKSTLADALTTLLVPHHKITFNKAAGAESKERSLKSYVRGEYKKEKVEYTNIPKEVYLRPEPNTYSILIANFNNDGYNEIVSLAQIFWIKDDKVEKLLVIATKTLSITDHFSHFTDITELKKRLRNDQTVEIFDDNFSKYSERFRRLFGMNSDKAIDLFYQTVSMKSVSSLTGFVREHMLEKTDVKARIDDLRKRFDDLNKAHQAVVTAREQLEILKPLVDHATQYRELETKILKIGRIITLMPAWFAEKKIDLLESELKNCEIKLSQLQNQLDSLERSLQQLKSKELQIHQDIHDNGGKRLEEIEKERQQHEMLKEQKLSRSQEYSGLSAICNIPFAEEEEQFYINIKKADDLTKQIDQRQKQLIEERDELKSEERNIKLQISSELVELDSLRNRKTQIPDYMITVRTQIAEDLGIDIKEIPFIGELLKVNEDNLEWEGAIERLLHSFGMSMIVPVNLYSRISHYVNNTVLQSKDGRRQRLVYYKADEKDIKSRQTLVPSDSVVNKLEIKPDTDIETWLYQELINRFNYSCVSFEDFQRLPDAITREGQIKAGWKRHEKDDRRNIFDRRQYVLGWSNTEKIKALEESLANLEKSLRSIESKIKTNEQESSNNKLVEKSLNDFLRIKNYDEINWKKENITIQQLKEEKTALENSNDVLKALQLQLDQVKAKLTETDSAKQEKNQEIGQIKGDILKHAENLKECQQTISSIDDQPDKDLIFSEIQSRHIDVIFTLKNIDNAERILDKKLTGEDGGERNKLIKDQNKQRDKIISRMKDIKDHSKAETSELPSEIEALPEYLKMFEGILRDDLPRHEKKFKEELNKNTIRSIAIFNSKLEGFEKDIQDKIEEINKHLREIEYNKGTYIKILTDPAEDQQIKIFREDLKNCYSHSFSDSDIYTEEKYNQVKKILDRFNSAQSSDIDWTAKVTDVRHWFDFNASERYVENDSEKEFFPGSSGKSGGQKEKLAYTILASALAFQFGLISGESKSRSFRFVVIDEAFGRGSDESTRYALELFKKLNLQLLIVTPLQKINIIENYVNTVHFVSNKDGNNSQVRNLTYAEYLEEKVKRQFQTA